MGDAHSCFDLVDVLPALAPRSERVDLEIGGVDLDLYVILDFRIDKDGCKGGVSSCIGIEGRYAHKAMDTVFSLQVAIGKLPNHLDGRALDTSSFAIEHVCEAHFESISFTPSCIHPEEHLSPILRFGTSCARVNRQQSILRIVNTTEHVFQLEAFDLSIELLLIAEDLFGKALFVRLLRQLNECVTVACKGVQLLPRVNPLLMGVDKLKNLLCCNVIIPEVLLVRPGLELFEIDEFLVQVKDTPSATQVASSAQPVYP